MSKGDRVPDVMTTVLNRSKTGRIAKDASRHLERVLSLQEVVGYQ